MTDTIWTPALMSRLRAMWLAGATTRSIAAAIGCTKNAVIGKAGRMGLSRRPSPIKGRVENVDTPRTLRLDGCRYIHGDPGRGQWRFCGAGVTRDAEINPSGRPYCAEHARKCFVILRRGERAASASAPRT